MEYPLRTESHISHAKEFSHSPKDYENNASLVASPVSSVHGSLRGHTERDTSSVQTLPGDLNNKEVCDKPVADRSDLEKAKEGDNNEANVPPLDQGYAWVVCFSSVLVVISTWGANAGYGVFLNFYMVNGTFAGATNYDFAIIGGLVTFLAMFLAPVSVLLYSMFGIRFICILGSIIQLAAYLLASFATKIWQLYCTQGLLVGVSFSLLFIPTTIVLPTWFDKHKAFAMGITVSGAGLGGVIFCLSLDKVIQDTGDQRWALRMVGIISTVLTSIASVLLKPRINKKSPMKESIKLNYIWGISKKILDYHVFSHWPVVILTGWFSIVMLGYVLILFSIDSYAHMVGLTNAQGSALTAILNAGQAIGRPAVGHFGDRFGRSNTGILYCLIICILCLAYWINAGGSYGALIPLSLLLGLCVGVGSTLAQPILTDIVLDSSKQSGAWASVNLICSFFALVAEVIALALTRKNNSQPFLHTQIFAGVAFFFAMMLMFLIRSNLVQRRYNELLEGSFQRLSELKTSEGTHSVVDNSGLDQDHNINEEASIRKNIASYERILRGGFFQFCVRMFYPVKI